MATTPTPKWKVPIMEPLGQATNSLTKLNDFISRMDSACQMSVKDVQINDPPSASDGDGYQIGTSPTGAWAAHAGKLTIYALGVLGNSAPGSINWLICSDFEGARVFVENGNYIFTRNGIQWAGGQQYADLGGGASVSTVVTRVNNLLNELEAHGVISQ